MEILLILLAALAAVAYFWYASMIGKRNNALSALSGIDIQLQKRSELIPNILTIAKKFMEHERALMEDITALRESAAQPYNAKDPHAVKDHLASAEQLQAKIGEFMIRVENYPELKSQDNMLQAQRTYNEVEEQLSAARRFYNSSVTALNNAVQIFPGNVIAGMAGVRPMPFYEAPATVVEPVNAAEILG